MTPPEKATTSTLAMGAPASGEQPSAPWWNDQDKLLKEVMRLAAQDAAFADRVAKAAGALGRKDVRFKASLKAATKAAKRGAQAVPYARHVQLLHELEFLRSRWNLVPAKAYAMLAKVYRVMPETMASRAKAARRVVDPADFEKVWIDSIPPVTDE